MNICWSTDVRYGRHIIRKDDFTRSFNEVTIKGARASDSNMGGTTLNALVR